MFIEQETPEKHKKTDPNPFDGVLYFAPPVNRFQVHQYRDGRTWLVGTFLDLESALAAKREFVQQGRIRNRKASSLLTHNSDTESENYATQASYAKS